MFAFSLGQVIFTKGNLHASLFCPGFKETALNRLLPPSFLIRFPTLVSILARRATSATSHDVWASCDLAAIVGIISMSSTRPRSHFVFFFSSSSLFRFLVQVMHEERH